MHTNQLETAAGCGVIFGPMCAVAIPLQGRVKAPKQAQLLYNALAALDNQSTAQAATAAGI